MTSTPLYFQFGTDVFVQIKGSSGKYDSAALTALGGSATSPSAGSVVPFQSLKKAVFAGLINEVIVNVSTTSAPYKHRAVRMACAIGSATSAHSLVGQNITLGVGTNATSWKVTGIHANTR